MILFRRQALLLIGPTGSGKTPLGESCEEEGLWGRAIHHFDFGRQLRQVSRQPRAHAYLSKADLKVIDQSLQTGALLEKENFRIAETILERFFDVERVEPNHVLMLNGLPRHIRQAEQVDAIVNIAMVVHLRCTPEVVLERIASNTGGDRTNRSDDSVDEVRKKLGVFQERTLPLLQHYRARGAIIEKIDVGIDSRAEQIRQKLEMTAALPFFS